MARDTGFHDYIMGDVLNGFSGISSKPMFGGYGIYKDGLVFAMIIQDKLYFKTDEISRASFEEAGSKPFIYKHKSGKDIAMSYYEVPEDVLEDRHSLGNWMQKALFAAMREKRKK